MNSAPLHQNIKFLPIFSKLLNMNAIQGYSKPLFFSDRIFSFEILLRCISPDFHTLIKSYAHWIYFKIIFSLILDSAVTVLNEIFITFTQLDHSHWVGDYCKTINHNNLTVLCRSILIPSWRWMDFYGSIFIFPRIIKRISFYSKSHRSKLSLLKIYSNSLFTFVTENSLL